MPSRSLHKCTYPGCSSLVKSGRCSKHSSARIYRDANAVRLYNSYEWKVLRKEQLEKEPMCMDCMLNNIIKVATDVDHIQPHRGDPKLFFDKNNLQSLCKKHHSMKTAREVWNKNTPSKKVLT